MNTGQIILNLFALILLIGCVIWMLYAWLRKSDDPRRLAFKWILTLILFPATVLSVLVLGPGRESYLGVFIGMGMLVLGCIALGIIWAPNIGAAIASPFTNLFVGSSENDIPPPCYSIAQAQCNRGHYQRAVAEVHKQLARFPEDFSGWMLLAKIQAEHFNDLPAARDCIDEIIAHGHHSPKNVAYALNNLADWHLKCHEDRASAQAALEQIMQLFPDTEQSHFAAQRLAHLADAEHLHNLHEPRRIPLPHSIAPPGGRGLNPVEFIPPEVADADLSLLLNHLRDHPQDNEAREQLAKFYAEKQQRLDLAAEQLQILIDTPHQPNHSIIHWFNLMADWHLKIGGDIDAARIALQRIVHRFPKTSAADMAFSRITYLQLQAKSKTVPHSIQLGSYEQNIGLKSNPPKAKPDY
jgi:tetratricopeptide (TPR) repeat protein